MQMLELQTTADHEYYLVEQRDQFQLRNRYLIFTADQHMAPLEEAGEFEEDNSCLERVCCLANRSFRLDCHFKGDQWSMGVCPVRFCCWELGCSPPELVVTQKDIKIGIIRAVQHCYKGSFYGVAGILIHVLDRNDNLLYSLENECCNIDYLCPVIRCCNQTAIQYRIVDATGTKVGKLLNIFNTNMLGLFGCQDKFGIEIPSNIPLHHKKLLLNSLILVDFLRWEI